MTPKRTLGKARDQRFQLPFIVLERWMEVLGPPPRPLWVHVKGLPLHIWHEKVFDLIGEFLGRAVKVDWRTVEEVDLQWGRIKVILNKTVSLPL